MSNYIPTVATGRPWKSPHQALDCRSPLLWYYRSDYWIDGHHGNHITFGYPSILFSPQFPNLELSSLIVVADSWHYHSIIIVYNFITCFRRIPHTSHKLLITLLNQSNVLCRETWGCLSYHFSWGIPQCFMVSPECSTNFSFLIKRITSSRWNFKPHVNLANLLPAAKFAKIN